MASWKKLLAENSSGVVSVSSKLGVGTSSPTTALHLNASEPVIRVTSANHGSGAGALEFWKESNSPADDDQIGHIRWASKDDAGNLMYMAVISAYSDDVTNGSEDASIRFTTTDAGVNAERMRIEGARVGIGTASPRGRFDVLGSFGGQGFYVTDYGTAVALPTDIVHSAGAGTFDIQVRNYRLGTSTGGNISIYPRHGTNSIGIGTASYQNRFFIDGSNGNTGIGTTSPQKTLHVTQTGTGDLARFESTGESFSIQYMADDSGTPVNYQFTHLGSKAIHYNNGNVVHASLKTGWVGIGTDSPSTIHHIHNSGATQGWTHYTNSSTGTTGDDGTHVGTNGLHAYVWNREAGDIYLGTQATSRLIVKSDGNVGIGEVSPTHRLEVKGHVAITDGYNLFMKRDGSSLRFTADGKVGGTNRGEFYMSADGTMNWTIGGTNRMSLTGNGPSVSNIYTPSIVAAGGDNLNIMASGTKLNLAADYDASGGSIDIYATGKSIGTAKTAQFAPSSFTTYQHQYIIMNYPQITMKSASTFFNEFKVISGGHTILKTSANTQSLIFGTADVEKMRLKGSNFGIGTDDPTYKFVVHEASDHSRMQISSGSVNHQTFLQFEADRPADNDTVGNIQFRVAGNVGSYIKGFRGSGDSKGDLVFGTSDVERLRINESGNISATGNLEVRKSFPDIVLRAGNEQRINFNDDGNAIQSGIKNNAGVMKFYGNSSSSSIRMVLDNTAKISLSNNDAGTQNTVFGNTAANGLLSGAQGNSAFGHEALISNTTGDRNTAIGYQAIRHNATGGENTAVGYEALRASSGNSTHNNTAIGAYTMYSISTGNENVAIGNQALYHNGSGTKNTAIGRNSMFGASGQSHTGNTAVGYKSLENITTGSYNVALGMESLLTTTTGEHNIAIGYNTLTASTGGSANTIIGYRAMYQAGGTQNIAIGADAMFQGPTGGTNYAIGRYSMMDCNAGSTALSSNSNIAFGPSALGGTWADAASNFNTAIGHYSMDAGVNGALNNTALGYQSLTSLTTGDSNISIGNQSLRDVSSGGFNVAIGHQAGMQQTTGSGSVNIGYLAGQVDSSSPNVIIGSGAFAASNTSDSGSNVILGYESGGSINHAGSEHNVILGRGAGVGGSGQFKRNVAIGSYAMDGTGSADVFGVVAIGYFAGTALGHAQVQGGTYVGYEAGKANYSAGHTTAIGYQALMSVTANGYNTAVGSMALNLATGNSNTAVGAHTLSAVTTGHSNTAMGRQAGDAIVSGEQNSLFGFQSGTSLQLGRYNSAIGYQSLNSDQHGSYTTALGYKALYSQLHGTVNGDTGNTGVGNQSGYHNVTGSNNTYIGTKAGYGASGQSHSSNTGVGSNSLTNVTTGDSNVAMGYEAGNYISSGHENTYIGTGAGRRTQTGDENVGIGYYALSDAVTGDANVGVGYKALGLLTSGVDNVAIGNEAGGAVTTGSYNIFIGDHNIGTSGMNGHTIIGTPDTDKTNLLGKIALYSASNWAYYSHYAHRYSTSDYAVKQKNDGTTYLNAKNAKKVHLAVNDANKLTVSGDWVGIGTSTPTQRLDVHGSVNIADTSGNVQFLFNTTNQSLILGSKTFIRGLNNTFEYGNTTGLTAHKFFTDGTQRVTINNTGRVGIGTTSPGTLLQVAGTTSIDGATTIGASLDVQGDCTFDSGLEVGGQTNFQDSVDFGQQDVAFTNSTVTGLNVSVTPTATNVFKSATNANNINFGSSTTVGNVSFAGGGVKNTTHITHTDNGSQVTLKTAGEYNISTNLVVTNDDSTDRFTAFSYVYHYNTGGTLLHKYGLEAIYIRGTGNNYNSGGMAGQIKLIVSANDYILVRVMVLDREGTGTIPLDAGYSDIKIDKITYSTT